MSVAAGLGACIICESIKRSEFTALTLSISLGAVTPIVMGLHLRNWMAYKCPIKSFIDVPSHGGLALDYNNAAFFLIGLVIMTEKAHRELWSKPTSQLCRHSPAHFGWSFPRLFLEQNKNYLQLQNC